VDGKAVEANSGTSREVKEENGTKGEGNKGE